ncbi:MAG: Holliday junction branch migration protein RuvA [Alphaproteobacteria bacterium]|nr:Holliday junction branch migration protein RuvA [Alphaproteobacteria bacterium]
MIGKLSGIIDSYGSNYLILDVQGVGYHVNASARTLGALGEVGTPAKLLIDTHVREDAITLYGFASAAEQAWFRLLTSVQGVGAKAGLAILSAVPAERLGIAIAAQDKAVLTQADGVAQLAVRILTELKDKAGKIDLGPGSLKTASLSAPASATKLDDTSAVENDALSALINLGYGRSEAYQAILRAKDKANDNLQALITAALKELSA